MPNLSQVPIAFFGGSFDPPHLGHLGVAQAALKSGLCRQVVFVPGWEPPHKIGRKRAPFADRLAMTRLLINQFPGISCSDIEGRLKLTPSYSIEVLHYATLELGEKPALLIGADSLLELHTWKRADELAREYVILTYPREEQEITPEKLLEYWPAEIADKLLAGVISGDFFKISSTEIRYQVANTALTGNIIDGAKYYTTPEIADYIKQHRIYQQEERHLETNGC